MAAKYIKESTMRRATHVLGRAAPFLGARGTAAANMRRLAALNYFSTRDLTYGDRAAQQDETQHQKSFVPPAHQNFGVHESRVSLLAELSDEPGALYHLLAYFWKHDVNCTQIESRPGPGTRSSVQLSFAGKRGDPSVDRLLAELRKSGTTSNMLVLDDKVVPWFPRHISDLDKIAHRVVEAGELQADHPGFTDTTYRDRRRELASAASGFAFGEPVPCIAYTPAEIGTWGTVYKHLLAYRQHACREYRDIMPKMEKHCGYGEASIPQAEDISVFLERETGFRLRPVAGLLSSRDFLNALAFRVFFSTQYIRHWSRPLYTPEPDICHELLGHAPMFADADFADFSQEIGLASLGASERDIKRLATCYWHSVEFGLLREQGQLKAYGAGVLSSFGEMAHAVDLPQNAAAGPPAPRPEYLPWEPAVAAEREYPITTYQPAYFVAESLHDAKLKMRAFCEELHKPFRARYNPLTQQIWVDRAVMAGRL